MNKLYSKVNCEKCDGTGRVYRQNGPDDYDIVECVCVPMSIDQLLTHLAKVGPVNGMFAKAK